MLTILPRSVLELLPVVIGCDGLTHQHAKAPAFMLSSLLLFHYLDLSPHFLFLLPSLGLCALAQWQDENSSDRNHSGRKVESSSVDLMYWMAFRDAVSRAFILSSCRVLSALLGLKEMTARHFFPLNDCHGEAHALPRLEELFIPELAFLHCSTHPYVAGLTLASKDESLSFILWVSVCLVLNFPFIIWQSLPPKLQHLSFV